MTGMTWLMVGIVILWTALFLYFTFTDLKCESKKSAILAAGGEVDPFMFSGEKARKEARDAYLAGDPVIKKYFDEEGLTKFLNIEENK